MAARTPWQHYAQTRSDERSSIRRNSRRSFPATISDDDVRSYVNVNLARLNRFVEREIYFREAQETILPGLVSKEEVIDEAIASALGDGHEKPEKLALEAWLYHKALRALEELSRSDEINGNAVHLEDSTRRRNVKASDEAELQFHQPDESMTGETVVADSRVATPEQILASDELLRLIASSLRDLGSGTREAFILHAVEGFSIEEIVAITGTSAERGSRLCRQGARSSPQVARPVSSVSRPLRSDRRGIIRSFNLFFLGDHP